MSQRAKNWILLGWKSDPQPSENDWDGVVFHLIISTWWLITHFVASSSAISRSRLIPIRVINLEILWHFATCVFNLHNGNASRWYLIFYAFFIIFKQPGDKLKKNVPSRIGITNKSLSYWSWRFVVVFLAWTIWFDEPVSDLISHKKWNPILRIVW